MFHHISFDGLLESRAGLGQRVQETTNRFSQCPMTPDASTRETRATHWRNNAQCPMPKSNP
ncbi:MAG: hypothetical protein ACHBN1_11290 [Heteroscytonema crispum UTEX LB 1556]